MAAAPEAKDTPEDQPLSNVPKSHDTRRDVQPQRLSGRRLDDAAENLRLRLRTLFRKAGAVVQEYLYMNYDVGIVHIVSILVVVCITLYYLCENITYALQVDQVTVY